MEIYFMNTEPELELLGQTCHQLTGGINIIHLNADELISGRSHLKMRITVRGGDVYE